MLPGPSPAGAAKAVRVTFVPTGRRLATPAGPLSTGRAYPLARTPESATPHPWRLGAPPRAGRPSTRWTWPPRRPDGRGPPAPLGQRVGGMSERQVASRCRTQRRYAAHPQACQPLRGTGSRGPACRVRRVGNAGRSATTDARSCLPNPPVRGTPRAGTTHRAGVCVRAHMFLHVGTCKNMYRPGNHNRPVHVSRPRRDRPASRGSDNSRTAVAPAGAASGSSAAIMRRPRYSAKNTHGHGRTLRSAIARSRAGSAVGGRRGGASLARCVVKAGASLPRRGQVTARWRSTRARAAAGWSAASRPAAAST
jgi:hypothetical protein